MKTLLGLQSASALAAQPVLVSRPVRVVSETRPAARDPFRGAPVGESIDRRWCFVNGVKMAAKLELVSTHDDPNDAQDAQREHLRTEYAAAIGRGDHVAATAIAKRMGAVREPA